MPPITYTNDLSLAAQVADLKRRMKRLENGNLLTGASVIPQVFTLQGPWPASITFAIAWPTSKVAIAWSISGFNNSPGLTTAAIKIDTVQKDTSISFLNFVAHEAFQTGFFVLSSLTVGNHTAQLLMNSGSSDSNDYGHILVLELP